METIRKIGRVSLFMQILAATFIVVLPGYHLLTWFAVDAWLQHHLAIRGLQIPIGETGGPKFAFAFLVETIPLAIELFVLYWIYQLFDCYRRGEVFAVSTIDRFRALARMLFLYTIVNPLAGAAVSVIVTTGRPGEPRMLVLGFGAPEIAALITGGVLAAIGWVMVEAKRLADDNTQIV